MHPIQLARFEITVLFLISFNVYLSGCLVKMIPYMMYKIIIIIIIFIIIIIIITIRSLGWDIDLKVLCFGSLGCIKRDVWTVLRSLLVDKLIVKNALQWCSISNLIMANYIWRHRVEKLFI